MSLPIEGSQWGSVFVVGDKPAPARADLPSAAFVPASVGYFETMGIRLVKGRTFDARDRSNGARVTIVNETLANRLWPGEEAIGKRIKQGWPETPPSESPWREVVGIVADVKLEGSTATRRCRHSCHCCKAPHARSRSSRERRSNRSRWSRRSKRRCRGWTRICR
jgi:hypothetical protein